MKPFLLLCLFGSFILLSCNKNIVQSLPVSDESSIKDIYGNYLEFTDQAAFDKAVEQAKHRKAEAQEVFEKSKQFVSMATRYRAFIKELDVLEYVKKDSTDLAALKKAYEASIYWPQPDMFEMNVPERGDAFLVNEKGFVKIGGQLLKLNYTTRTEFKKIDLEALAKAEKALQPTENDLYKITQVPRARDVYVDREPSTESWPGTTWMNLTHGNPQEGVWSRTVTDRKIQGAFNRRFDIQMEIYSTRKNGVLLGYINAIVHGQEFSLFTWRHVTATNIAINGSMRLEMAPVDISSGRRFFYANLYVPEWYYENDINVEGRQPLVVSKKLLEHPDLVNLSDFIAGRSADIFNATGTGSYSIIFDDKSDGGVDFSQYGLNYYWNRLKSWPALSPTDPYPHLTVDAIVAGIGFSINF